MALGLSGRRPSEACTWCSAAAGASVSAAAPHASSAVGGALAVGGIEVAHAVAHLSARLSAAKHVQSIAHVQHGVAVDGVGPCVLPAVGIDIAREVALPCQYVV